MNEYPYKKRQTTIQNNNTPSDSLTSRPFCHFPQTPSNGTTLKFYTNRIIRDFSVFKNETTQSQTTD